ncbi:uncharacterized protein si:dkey-117m1.4 isoform X2 [Polypterus senegalus]|uniref:uncharacterized protein si:dkey-117m1.4 isoform X2 n=1 Tax=Polypterus senegalus TaxID=55291 RepID=UPI0019647178|nr:uncharacterized protein si:dkey-117m1.4 isoform X2 [Polypterus senegalus]
MAAAVSSLYDYREPACLDSDGEGYKPPSRGNFPFKKQRKGIPMKVLERDTQADEDSFAESGDFSPDPYNDPCDFDESEKNRMDVPYFQPSHISSVQCSPSLKEEEALISSGSIYKAPNCKVREVFYGNQSHLQVFAIRDIAKGEEITIDYGLPEFSWRNNELSFQNADSSAVLDYSSDLDCDIKKEEDEPCNFLAAPGASTSEYIPSWSLSPTSSTSQSDQCETSSQLESPECCKALLHEEEAKTRLLRSRRKTHLVDDWSSAQSVEVVTKKNCTDAQGRRFYKKHYCMFCEKGFKKIARHLEQMHSNEPEVAKAVSHKKGSKERAILLQELRNKGDFSHNAAVLEKGVGQLITQRQPVKQLAPEDYLPCQYCLALYMKNDLWRHQKRCSLKTKRNNIGRGGRIQAEAALLLPAPVSSVGEGVQKLLGKMPQDKITLEVQNDPLILRFGDRLFLQAGNPIEKQRVSDICAKMRELAKLKMESQKLDHSISSLRDLVDSSRLDVLASSARNATGFEQHMQKYSSPSAALKLGLSLSKAAVILEGDAIRSGDESLRKKVERFKVAMKNEWAFQVSTFPESSMSFRYGKKWNKPHLLPLLEDLLLLQTQLREKEEISVVDLEQNPSAESWRSLCQATLIQVILFNRRRDCEVSKMLIQAYSKRQRFPSNEETESILADFEQYMWNSLARVEILGKRGRYVPLLLTPRMEMCMSLLLRTRDCVGIDEDNPYVFARPNQHSTKPLRGGDLLRFLAKTCGARHPEHLTSTRLRRQIATLSQLLCVESLDIERLATFLGHSVKIHLEYLQLPRNTTLLAKVARVLLAGEKDGLLFKGMTLDQICLELDVLSENSGNSSDEEEKPEETKPAKPVATGASHASQPRRLASEFPQKKGKKCVQKRPWSLAEKRDVEQHLEKHIRLLQVPAKADCERCLSGSPLLRSNGRDWKAVKFYVHNRIQLIKRHMKKGKNVG